jgi:hypothetical protein
VRWEKKVHLSSPLVPAKPWGAGSREANRSPDGKDDRGTELQPPVEKTTVAKPDVHVIAFSPRIVP